MSELEIKRRQEYKRNRKKWMLIQLAAIALLLVISLGTLLGYNRVNRTHYITYSENGDINYQIHYIENEFFDEEWISKDQSYISSLTDGINATFKYNFIADSSDMNYTYSYSINAKLSITSKDTGAPYYTVEEVISPEKTLFGTSETGAKIEETVFIDYAKFDAIAREFENTYGLDESAVSTLVVTMNVRTVTVNQKFDEETTQVYSTSLNVPMAEETFAITRTSGAPELGGGILEYKSVANKAVLFIIGIVAISLAALGAIALVVFMYLTRNEDVTYAAKIRKILKSYGSYIQRINGEFDSEGYQVVMIKTFVEMLGIRDTIQSPILAFENKDETMTSFLIPTNTKILYVFEIKVDNYDDIYAPKVEIEEPVILEEVDEEEFEEAIAQPDIDIEEINFIPDDDDEFEVPPEEPGIEVVGVVWPEKKNNNKVYRYDPNGEILNEGDIILVPTRDHAKGRDVIRKAAVTHGNHRVDPEHIKYPLKKIIAVIKRKVSTALTPEANEDMKNSSGGTMTIL